LTVGTVSITTGLIGAGTGVAWWIIKNNDTWYYRINGFVDIDSQLEAEVLHECWVQPRGCVFQPSLPLSTYWRMAKTIITRACSPQYTQRMMPLANCLYCAETGNSRRLTCSWYGQTSVGRLETRARVQTVYATCTINCQKRDIYSTLYIIHTRDRFSYPKNLQNSCAKKHHTYQNFFWIDNSIRIPVWCEWANVFCCYRKHLQDPKQSYIYSLRVPKNMEVCTCCMHPLKIHIQYPTCDSVDWMDFSNSL
jgi:hypothetical protein